MNVTLHQRRLFQHIIATKKLVGGYIARKHVDCVDYYFCKHNEDTISEQVIMKVQLQLLNNSIKHKAQ